jgi:hypothetical protein
MMQRAITAPLFVAIGVASLMGCTKDNPAFIELQAVCAENEFYVREPFQLANPDEVDILFVVDNGPGSLVAQQALADAMPTFVEDLESDADLDWRIAVTSTDLSDDGRLLTGIPGQAGCPADSPDYVQGSTQDAGGVAGCNVVIGQNGDAIRQSFKTARLAVQNGGFRRDSARLVVVFFSLRDDCTAAGGFDRADVDNCIRDRGNLESVGDYQRFFVNDASGRRGTPVSIVSITGPTNPEAGLQAACTGVAQAWSGNRTNALSEFAWLERHSIDRSICALNFEPALADAYDVAVRPADDALCASLPMSGSPEAVVLRPNDDADPLELSPFGDYMTEGSASWCENGVIAVSTDSHDDSTGHRAEVWFCTETDPRTLQ